jgi:hypothetical protein
MAIGERLDLEVASSDVVFERHRGISLELHRDVAGMSTARTQSRADPRS